MKKIILLSSIILLTSCNWIEIIDDANDLEVEIEDSKIEANNQEEVQLIGEKEIEKEERFKVIAESLNLREGPGLDYNKIGSLIKNDEVKILENLGEWVKVDAGNGRIGYLKIEYLDPVDESSMTRDDKDDLISSENSLEDSTSNSTVTEDNIYRVIPEKINVRSYASELSEIKDQITSGMEVEIILDTNLTGNEWVKISYQGKEGYVMKEFLEGE